MTLRIFSLSLAVGALALTGCKQSADVGDADLDGIAEGRTVDQLAYDAGFRLGEQQDSTFSFDRFEAGFRAGLNNDSAEVAYALGLQVGLSLRADTVANINSALFLASFKEGLQRGEPRLTQGQVARARSVFQDSLQMNELRQRAPVDSTARAFLTQVERGGTRADSLFASLRGKQGVQQTPSGVYYAVNRQGSGASPTENDRVRVEYVGTLPNGTEFDRSEEGQPVEMAVGGVVPGFSEMLQAMKPGETRTIYIPSQLGYGMQGRPGPNGVGGIPPSSALVFRVTLVDVLAGPGPQQQMMFPGM